MFLFADTSFYYSKMSHDGFCFNLHGLNKLIVPILKGHHLPNVKQSIELIINDILIELIA